MGQSVSRTDYEWVYTDEPHKTRREQILAKYPQVKGLMGKDVKLVPIAFFMVLAQLISAYFLRDASWPLIIIVGYLWGGVINHSIMVLIHETGHNLAFGNSQPMANRLLGMFANLPLFIPLSASFKRYHLDHHKYMGVEGQDLDIPLPMEGKLFSNTFTKILWVVLLPIFYLAGPLFYPKPITSLEIINIITQGIFNVLVVYIMNWRSLVYLGASTYLGMSLHPIAGHFISEHYIVTKGQETYSYYGWANYIMFNVGYHNEHHDFPNIPGSRLPKLKAIAAEFYDNHPSYTSYTWVIYNFITNPEISPFSRIKRNKMTSQKESTNKEN